MDGQCPKSYLSGLKKTSEFNEDFIKSYNNESHEGYDLEIDV